MAVEDDKWKFHVIKDERLFVSEISLDITDVAYHTAICGDKLIMDLYNPDDGNYVKIYKIRTTEN